MTEVVVNRHLSVHYSADHKDGEGNLISRSISVQSPPPPTCLKFSCLFKFLKDSFFVALLTSYHARRVAYAEGNRHNQILERYRTGNPSPENIWQAIHANIKLRCPVCRKYNVDPFLFKSNKIEKLIEEGEGLETNG